MAKNTNEKEKSSQEFEIDRLILQRDALRTELEINQITCIKNGGIVNELNSFKAFLNKTTTSTNQLCQKIYSHTQSVYEQFKKLENYYKICQQLKEEEQLKTSHENTEKYEEKLKELEEQEKEMLAELSDFEKKREIKEKAFQEECKVLEEKCEDVKKKLKTKDTLRNQLQNNINDLSQSLQAKDSEMAEILSSATLVTQRNEEDYLHSRKENDILRNEIIQHEESIQELKNDRQVQIDIIKALNLNYDKLKDEINMLSDENSRKLALIEEISKNHSEVQQRNENALNTITSDILKVQNQLRINETIEAELKLEMEGVLSKIKSIDSEIDSFNLQLSQSGITDEELEILENELVETNEILEKLHAQQTELTDNYVTVKQKIVDLQKESVNNTIRINAQEEEVRKLEEELEKVELVKKSTDDEIEKLQMSIKEIDTKHAQLSSELNDLNIEYDQVKIQSESISSEIVEFKRTLLEDDWKKGKLMPNPPLKKLNHRTAQISASQPPPKPSSQRNVKRNRRLFMDASDSSIEGETLSFDELRRRQMILRSKK